MRKNNYGKRASRLFPPSFPNKRKGPRDPYSFKEIKRGVHVSPNMENSETYCIEAQKHIENTKLQLSRVLVIRNTRNKDGCVRLDETNHHMQSNIEKERKKKKSQKLPLQRLEEYFVCFPLDIWVPFFQPW